ncbi:Csu type fimbrial protein [Sphingomonas profundi]|uniref:Csu type fimbrial protein n=1 Tax=Alterirhizorhabdus profundi TaxID=2681549 RepID=UPI0012E92DA9|nr:spore coat U domain-containing protein [Sphingomonas profundi]
MPVILRLLAVLAGLLLAGPAQAACTLASATTAIFAPASSYDVRSGSIATITAPQSFACNGSIISIVASNYARATMTSTNGFKLRNASGDTIGYRLSADAAGTTTFNGGATVDYMNPTLLSLLGILNGGSFAPPIYAAIAESPNISAGVYTDTVQVNWAWDICHGVGVGGVCVLGEIGTGTTTMTVQLTVSRDCRISAPAVSFGTAPLVSQFSGVTQAVAVDCTKGSAFNVAFTSGVANVSRPWRAMKDAAGNVLQYNIYRADGTTVWDQLNPLVAAATGTGAITATQMIPYVARINPAQQTPPAGQYTDSVSVVVTF